MPLDVALKIHLALRLSCHPWGYLIALKPCICEFAFQECSLSQWNKAPHVSPTLEASEKLYIELVL